MEEEFIVEFWEKNCIKSICDKKNGKPHGRETFFYHDGQVLCFMEFKNGMPDGFQEWTTPIKHFKVMNEIYNFKKDSIHGARAYFFF